MGLGFRVWVEVRLSLRVGVVVACRGGSMVRDKFEAKPEPGLGFGVRVEVGFEMGVRVWIGGLRW